GNSSAEAAPRTGQQCRDAQLASDRGNAASLATAILPQDQGRPHRSDPRSPGGGDSFEIAHIALPDVGIACLAMGRDLAQLAKTASRPTYYGPRRCGARRGADRCKTIAEMSSCGSRAVKLLVSI